MTFIPVARSSLSEILDLIREPLYLCISDIGSPFLIGTIYSDDDLYTASGNAPRVSMISSDDFIYGWLKDRFIEL